MANPNKSRQFLLVHTLFCVLCSVIYLFISSNFFSSSGFNGLVDFVVLGYIWIGYTALYIDKKNTMKTNSFFALLGWPIVVWKSYDLEFQTPSTGTYNAYVNDVYVGNISDNDYYAIKRKVLRNPVLYFTQAGNFFRILFISLDRFLLAMPIFTFWGMLWLGYMEPTTYTNVLAVIQNNPLELTHFIGNYFVSVVSIFYMFLLVHFALMGRVPGFDNKFSAYTSLLLRQKLGVAAEGKISLSRPLSELMSTTTE